MRAFEDHITRQQLLKVGAAGTFGLYLGGRVPSARAAKVTITTWDFNASGRAISNVLNQLNREFQAAHPGVSINRVVKGYDDLKATAQRGLADPNGPDIAQLIQGRTSMGPLIKGNYLLPLNPYFKRYSWGHHWPASARATSTFTADGKAMGKGSLYGAALTAEISGLFYNKEILAKYNIPVPRTFADLERAFATVKSHGQVPLVVAGTDDGWWAMVLYTLVRRKWLHGITFLTTHESFNTPEFRKSCEIVLDWKNKGYFTPGFQGISLEEAATLFGQGKGVFFLDYTDHVDILIKNGGPDKFGFKLTPPQTTAYLNRDRVVYGDWAEPFSIKKKSTQTSLDVEYLAYITSAHAMKLLMKNGELPAWVPQGAPNLTRVQQDVFRELDLALRQNAIGGFFELSFPSGFDTIVAGFSAMLAGKLSPAKFANQVDHEYQRFYKSIA